VRPRSAGAAPVARNSRPTRRATIWTEGSTPASAETGEKLLEKDEKLTNRKERENVETENPNGFKRSWDRESPKLSEPGREFFSVADHDADCSATRTLCYPQPIESKRLFKN
jgi:hypothetical protein